MNVHEAHHVEGHKPFSVGVIGGGIAGSTIALRLAELGIQVKLFEEGSSLVNGPPICHLHAGGNLYREISNQQCQALLKQSIDTLRVFPQTTNIRPTVIAIPKRDQGDPKALLNRLDLLQNTYKTLVENDPKNQVLGQPEHYFKLYYQDDLEQLAQYPLPTTPTSLDDWMIPVAKNLSLNEFKYPLILVQEYGLSIFRLASIANLAAEKLPDISLHTNAKVIDIKQDSKSYAWSITYQQYDRKIKDHITHTTSADYLVNACGYRTGTIDDMANLTRKRMVEFKAAYVTHWAECEGIWPEVIFHGERGTPNGMAQLTPYPGGYFQLHGMTEDITLFRQGLATTTGNSAQPRLSEPLTSKIKSGWKSCDIHTRTERAIEHVAKLLPTYRSATVGGNPLFGAQQIPGGDPSLRAADISFAGKRYARSEIVKASSALSAADKVLEQLQCEGLLPKIPQLSTLALEAQLPVTSGLDLNTVVVMAEKLASSRSYPEELARPVRYEII
ncbi:NAD(P)-binding protein [uncultured Photobacterium sp.]|uniref:NAD(P)-binding protein n=1 Tax=uncultured Photobacterium sp. TaxID=173973 RepID=UPI0026041880|nr:NAD(P)-binding protein [uncultured Photobacterium sp.]